MSAEERERARPPQESPTPAAEAEGASARNDASAGGEKQETKGSPFPTPKMERIDLNRLDEPIEKLRGRRKKRE